MLTSRASVNIIQEPQSTLFKNLSQHYSRASVNIIQEPRSTLFESLSYDCFTSFPIKNSTFYKYFLQNSHKTIPAQTLTFKLCLVPN